LDVMCLSVGLKSKPVLTQLLKKRVPTTRFEKITQLLKNACQPKGTKVPAQKANDTNWHIGSLANIRPLARL
jgi:hypothetical protein